MDSIRTLFIEHLSETEVYQINLSDLNFHWTIIHGGLNRYRVDSSDPIGRLLLYDMSQEKNNQFAEQDSYYRNESDSGHVLHPGTNSIDWEVLQVFGRSRKSK